MKDVSQKSLSNVIIWQIFGKFALQGVFFFTAPIMTRLLNPSDYGITALFASWSAIMTLVIGMDTGGSIANAKIYYEEKIDEYLSSIMSISLISFTIVFIIFFFFRRQLVPFIGLRSDLIVLLVLSSFASYIVSFYTTKLDQYKRAKESALLSLISSCSSIFLALFFVFKSTENRAFAKIYGQVFPTILFGSVIIVIIYLRGRCFFNKQYWKFCLSFTLPLMFHSIGGLIFSQSDRLMLQKLQNEGELGIYSVSFSLCNVLTIIYQALNVSWVPFYYEYKKESRENEIKLHSVRYVKLFLVIFLGFLFLSPDVFKLMAPREYYKGLYIIPIISLGMFYNFLYLFPVNFEFYHRKTSIIPIITLINALINILMNFLFIPRYGILGAAIGTMIAHMTLFFMHDFAARCIVREKFEYLKTFYLLPIIFSIIGCVLYYIILDYIIIRWSFAVILTIYQIFVLKKNKTIF